jgi:hypothetical protein
MPITALASARSLASCSRSLTKLLSSFNSLTVVERVAVRFHLSICLMCTRFTGQVKLMNSAMAQWKRYTDHD